MGLYSGTTKVVSYASSSKEIRIEFKKLIDFFVLKKMFYGLRIKNQFVLKLKMRRFGLKDEIKMRIKVSLPVDDGDESSDFFLLQRNNLRHLLSLLLIAMAPDLIFAEFEIGRRGFSPNFALLEWQ